MTTTDVFSLAQVTADELRWSEQPWRHHSCYRASSVGPPELARLADALGVGDATEVIREFSLLAGESQESPWVVSLPSELMARISQLSGSDARAVARRWAARCEFASDASAFELRVYLTGLVDFVRRSDGPYALYVRLGPE